MSNKKWVTKKGKELELHEMSTTHLYNSTRLLEERGLLIYPEMERLRQRDGFKLNPRNRMVLRVAKTISYWIPRLRAEMAQREGIEGMTGLEVYNQYFSIVDSSKQLQPNTLL